MKVKNFFVTKFVVVTLMLGFFSPTVNIHETPSSQKAVSLTKFDFSQGLLTTLSTSEITFTLFTQAEARKKEKYKKAKRKARRKARRRANYRHHRYHEKRREHRRDVAGALIIGGIVGAALNEASQDP